MNASWHIQTGPASDTKCALLEVLRSNHVVSGEEIARTLRISRQALHKHIHCLQQKGYRIKGIPHKGYILQKEPDKLFPWSILNGLDTKYMARTIRSYEKVVSTQDIAWKLGTESFPEGTLVVSETQQQGRGRLKRTWSSPKGGIYFSLLLRPHSIRLSDLPQISLLLSLACARTIERSTGIRCTLKWPNDVLIKGKKLAGILCETHAETDRMHFLVCGIGININTAPSSLPPSAVSLSSAAGSRFSRVVLLQRLLLEIETLYEQAKPNGFRFVRDRWKEYFPFWGKTITFTRAGQKTTATAQGLTDKGHLIIKTPGGKIEKLSSGEIFSPSERQPE